MIIKDITRPIGVLAMLAGLSSGAGAQQDPEAMQVVADEVRSQGYACAEPSAVERDAALSAARPAGVDPDLRGRPVPGGAGARHAGARDAGELSYPQLRITVAGKPASKAINAGPSALPD